MFNNIKNQISFQAVYALKGTKRQNQKLYEHIKTINKINGAETDCYTPDSAIRGNKNLLVVLTESDTQFKNDKSYRLADLMDRAKNKIIDSAFALSDYVYISAKRGRIREICEIPKEDGITYLTDQNGTIEAVEYDKPLPIKDALQKIQDNFGNMLNSFTYRDKFHALYSVLENDKFKDLKVKRCVTTGLRSFVFELDNDKVLKFSFINKTPEKLYDFDLPILESGKIEIKQMPLDFDLIREIYYEIQPKGLNVYDTQITLQHLKQLAEKINIAGAHCWDMREEQIVLYKGEPYLADSDCIRREYYFA